MNALQDQDVLSVLSVLSVLLFALGWKTHAAHERNRRLNIRAQSRSAAARRL